MTRICEGSRRSARSMLVPSVLIAVIVLGAGVAGRAHAAKDVKSLTLYSVATEEQFVDNADDRQRIRGNNPFGNFKDTTATTKEKGNGPFPGDEALFKFNIFTDPKLKSSGGTAVFTCLYNFNKNAYCAVTYQLTAGTLIGAGAFNFNANTFSVAITGGTAKYRGETGEMDGVPGPNHAQRLTFIPT